LHAHADTNKWGKLLYTHYQSTKVYAAPASAAAVLRKLDANEAVKADFKEGSWYAVFKPSESIRSMANAVGYMEEDDLFPSPLQPDASAAGGGDCPPVASSIEGLRAIPIDAPHTPTGFAMPTTSYQPPADQPAAKTGSKEPKKYSEGNSFKVGYTSYTVSRSWWSDRLSNNMYLDQKPNAMYLFVELTVKNEDTKERMIPPFHLIDGKGREYGASTGAWVLDGWMGVLDSLNPGVSQKGFVVFDVPKGNTYKLKVSGGFWSLEDAVVAIFPR